MGADRNPRHSGAQGESQNSHPGRQDTQLHAREHKRPGGVHWRVYSRLLGRG